MLAVPLGIVVACVIVRRGPRAPLLMDKSMADLFKGACVQDSRAAAAAGKCRVTMQGQGNRSCDSINTFPHGRRRLVAACRNGAGARAARPGWLHAVSETG
jgi:hypothetical protein